MEEIPVRDAAASTPAEGTDGHGLTEALGTTDVAINHYRLGPGTRLSGLHAHGDQEEVFLVLEGTATFETYAPPGGAGRAGDDAASAGGTVDVAAGEAVRFAPGEYQSATNPSESPVELYAIGAPRGTEDVRIPLACPACDHGFVRPALADDGARPVLRCPDCGEESPVECPDCGGDDVTARLGDDGQRPVSACRDCGFVYESLGG